MLLPVEVVANGGDVVVELTVVGVEEAVAEDVVVNVHGGVVDVVNAEDDVVESFAVVLGMLEEVLVAVVEIGAVVVVVVMVVVRILVVLEEVVEGKTTPRLQALEFEPHVAGTRVQPIIKKRYSTYVTTR